MEKIAFKVIVKDEWRKVKPCNNNPFSIFNYYNNYDYYFFEE